MIELRTGTTSLAVDPAHGGRLASLRALGREFLAGPPSPHDASVGWGSFLMAPWVGRLEDGILEFGGERHQLARTYGRNAIHGVVYSRSVDVEAQTGAEATLSCRIGPPDWPYRALVRQEFVLGEDQLRVMAEVIAEEAMPTALGWHPWFARADADASVRVDAGEVLEARDLIPTGRRTAVDATTDLRAGPLLGARALDLTYVNARSPAVVGWPDVELTIEFEPPVNSVHVYTPPDAFCVEPQTAWPSAPALAAHGVSDTGLVTLAPSDRLGAVMTWRWHPAVVAMASARNPG